MDLRVFAIGVLWALAVGAAHAQAPPAPAPPPAALAPDTAGVRDYAEQMPRFRHGRGTALADFVERNRRWPKDLWKTQGRVFVTFIVTAEGGVRNARVVKGFHPTLDAEALRVAQLLDGKFWPAKQDGRAVAVRYTLAVPFVSK